MARTIKASQFKANCLALMDEVARTGQAMVITKNGTPIADVVPHRSSKKKTTLRGIWKDQVVITGDIISPIDAEWGVPASTPRPPRAWRGSGRGPS